MTDFEWNQAAWDQAVNQGDNPYTKVVSAEDVAAARLGSWSLYLSDSKMVPREWFPPLPGLQVLCLAAGGGQQAPILAALGAQVTLLDASARQLEQDRSVAERDGLDIRLEQGDMIDLSRFEDGSFELIVNPPSTLFVPELAPFWRECYRVLQVGGVLMTGFMNPDEFIFDNDALDSHGQFVVKYPLPYAESETLSPEVLEQRVGDRKMFHFSHTLETQLGGLIAAGFVISGFYEDRRSEQDGNPIRHYMPSYYVARASKSLFN
jgi:ubiquinone/menaquinone biosynthesis C-methylase UbiE